MFVGGQQHQLYAQNTDSALKRASCKLRAPAGLKRLRARIRRTQLQEAGVMMLKERPLAAWAYGPWLTRTEVERLVAKAQR